ncbi:MAG: hypothetical protein A2506_02730 [Elusimicrobia bacterium RIFOXYD12_FULL_66_9]|nr:MAG: hypothetical protein A2506_02730 [Elusimicrobia bacterium RIFOXYD12_FULL_66_9]
MSPLVALLLDWLITALWPLIGAVGIRHYSGIFFAAGGLMVGLVLLSPWLAAHGRWRRIFSWSAAPYLATMGFCSGLATVIYISALSYTTPANAAIVAQVEVLYSAALCAWLLGERPGRRQIAASLLVMAGTGLVMAHDFASDRWRGDLMILATPWLYQVSHIAAKRLPRDMDALTLSGGRVIYGLATMAPFCLWAATHGARWSWAPAALGMLVVQGAVMSSLNFVLWYKAIMGMDLSKATVIMLSYPALTVVFSWLLGREHIGATQLAGLVVTMSGAMWTSSLVLEAQRRREHAR